MSKPDVYEDETVSRLLEVEGQDEAYHAYHDPAGSATLSETVIEAIADIADVDPTTTLIPLAEAVDPDSLDTLFENREANPNSCVVFYLCGLEVATYADGHVRIRNAPSSTREE
ncbi:HalOD1 output domain-containing protein [Halorussus halophilus]|uniref:HalOD1 output domain-containing protein n=1 Tax=Halorussus halophilus TaxID=2650975 RepID=UPI001300CD53|nr:HalOD1 output domain-containing protein [Halorussus halophilus]